MCLTCLRVDPTRRRCKTRRQKTVYIVIVAVCLLWPARRRQWAVTHPVWGKFVEYFATEVRLGGIRHTEVGGFVCYGIFRTPCGRGGHTVNASPLGGAFVGDKDQE